MKRKNSRTKSASSQDTLCDEDLTRGLSERTQSKRATKIQKVSAIDIDSAVWANSIQKQCKICQDDFDVVDMFTVNCMYNHRICFTCEITHFQMAVLGDSETPPHIPACPYANFKDEGESVTCNHLFDEAEARQFVDLCASKDINLITEETRCTLQAAIRRLYIAKAHRDLNHVRCVGCQGVDDADGVWFEVDDDVMDYSSAETNISVRQSVYPDLHSDEVESMDDAAYCKLIDEATAKNDTKYDSGGVQFVSSTQSSSSASSSTSSASSASSSLEPAQPLPGRLVICPRCRTHFCLRCKTSPYHFHCSCNDQMAYARAWLDWANKGRFRALLTRATMDSTFKSLTKKYEKYLEATQAPESQALMDATRRFAELVADEALKARTCKRCPHCQRVVEKLSGCDSMKCGQNYHGGDVQMGCGKGFMWSSALPYIANVGDAKTKDEVDADPVRGADFQHMICEGEPMLCDSCRNPIVGPRIKCLNCPDHSLCLKCDVLAAITPPKVPKPPKPLKTPRVAAAKSSSNKKKKTEEEVVLVEVVQNTTRSGRAYKNKDLNDSTPGVTFAAISSSSSSSSSFSSSSNNNISKPVQEVAEEDDCQLIARTSSVGRSISITRSSSLGHCEGVDLGGHQPNHVCTVLYH
mmetsp:Transcript_32508/g.44565  ORF Transcript_32508/g.44565 Transcript_32508/m.44565 type:complete len:639 (-) Transcript_32508:254-2170(-)